MVDVCLAVRVHRLQVVDGVLDVVGLVRRLPYLLEELANRSVGRGNRRLVARLGLLQLAECILGAFGLTPSGANNLTDDRRYLRIPDVNRRPLYDPGP